MNTFLDIQNAILEAVDSLTSQRIDKLQLDKTVVAEIIICTDALKREYKCAYNGGFFVAYAHEGVTYTPGQSVYVLIPQNDFSNTKTIVGLSSAQDDDNNISFVSSALADYNLIGKNVINDKHQIQPLGLHSYKNEDYWLLYDHDLKDEPILDTDGRPTGKYYRDEFVSINELEFKNNLKEAEALMVEANFQTRLPKKHRLSSTGSYGLQFVLAFSDRNETVPDENEKSKPDIKYLSYVIDSNNMTGSPMNFIEWSEQYQIFPIDIKNFLYIDSILFYSKGFENKTDPIQVDSYGTDIFLKEIEVYPLKRITAVNGDYKLSISMPQGSTFVSIEDLQNNKLDVNASVIEKNANDLSNDTTFYWFKEDGRVTSKSENFHMYGGAGWAWLGEKQNTNILTAKGNDNRSYENKYLCVAVYKEKIILKANFVLYNESVKRDIKIDSSLGLKFSFDRGTPKLTCLINGKSSNFEEDEGANKHDDTLFSFVWSKVDDFNNVITFNETVEELEKQYKEAKTPAEKMMLKSRIKQLQGVSWDKNILYYPVKQIDTHAKFKCSVYLQENSEDTNPYCIGIAEITLKNEDIVEPDDYYIVIENGDQVFQYSESGVAPNDKRYTDPLEIKPLTCHFFDPAGLEINSDTYDVKWVIPLENTLLKTPMKGMIENNSNKKKEIFTEEIYLPEIKAAYDYQALNNQVKALISYQDKEFSKYSNFLFTKIGENGTNGTDIVTKISPKVSKDMEERNELLTIEVKKEPNEDNVDNRRSYYGIPKSSTNVFESQQLTGAKYECELYNRSEQLALTSNVRWSIAGSNTKSKYLTLNGTTDIANLGWNTDDYYDTTNLMYRYQIIKAEVSYERNQYYAFQPIPVIEYNAPQKFKVVLDKSFTIKSITYNADGRNPLYNKNQGVQLQLQNQDGSFIKFIEPSTDEQDAQYYVKWSAEGGNGAVNLSKEDNDVQYYTLNPKNAAFTLETRSINEDGEALTTPVDEQAYYNWNEPVYVVPNNIYSGEYTNNIIHGSIFQSKLDTAPICEVYVPIHMSLNTYGLKSLNAWDGNHVEINEDDNYVLAPQIGAGKKNDKNQFTGILMGTSQTYDQKKEQIGLLGYSAGEQSIWLDAETGKAVFGLPEKTGSIQNRFTEGRIELIPGGESKIGQWRIGSRAIYNMTQPGINGDSYTGVEPDTPYTHYAVKGAQISVPYNAQGIILNANPSYVSFKGRPITRADNFNFNDANAAIEPGDSFEVEIDPNKISAFSIYRHTKRQSNGEIGEPRRYPLVGINAQGQFYTNAIENAESSMGIGKVGAFGKRESDDRYLGAKFSYKTSQNSIKNILKIYVPSENNTDEEIPKNKDGIIYLSSGSTITDEYSRKLKLNFASINTYVNSNSSNLLESPYTFQLSSAEMFLGKAGPSEKNGGKKADGTLKADDKNRSYLRLKLNENEKIENELQLNSNFLVQLPEKATFRLAQGPMVAYDRHPIHDVVLLEQASKLTLYLKDSIENIVHDKESGIYTKQAFQVKDIDDTNANRYTLQVFSNVKPKEDKQTRPFLGLDINSAATYQGTQSGLILGNISLIDYSELEKKSGKEKERAYDAVNALYLNSNGSRPSFLRSNGGTIIKSTKAPGAVTGEGMLAEGVIISSIGFQGGLYLEARPELGSTNGNDSVLSISSLKMTPEDVGTPAGFSLSAGGRSLGTKTLTSKSAEGSGYFGKALVDGQKVSLLETMGSFRSRGPLEVLGTNTVTDNEGLGLYVEHGAKADFFVTKDGMKFDRKFVGDIQNFTKRATAAINTLNTNMKQHTHHFAVSTSVNIRGQTIKLNKELLGTASYTTGDSGKHFDHKIYGNGTNIVFNEDALHRMKSLIIYPAKTMTIENDYTVPVYGEGTSSPAQNLIPVSIPVDPFA